MFCDDRCGMMMVGSGRWRLVLIDHVCFFVVIIGAECCFLFVMVNVVVFVW
jgi:hypothetical protein